MSDRNKIAQELTIEELDAFVSELAALKGSERTLKAIMEKAAGLGITISLMSAKSFKDTTFKRYLAELRASQSLAEEVAAVDATGNTLADASAKLLARQVFDELRGLEGFDIKSAGKLAFIIKSLREGDVQRSALNARLRESEAKLAALAAREKEREDKQRQAAEQLAKLRAPQTADNEKQRAAILDEVDKLMGIRKG